MKLTLIHLGMLALITCVLWAVRGVTADLNASCPISQDAMETPWISNLIAYAMSNYYPYGENTSSLCSEHGRLIRIYSANYTIWALRMIDSNSKGPAGSIYGNVYDYGHFDQCISTRGLNDSIRGQFIMLSLDFQPKEPFRDWKMEPDDKEKEFLRQDDSYWDIIKLSRSIPGGRIRGRNTIRWAICVPRSCSMEDIQFSAETTLMPVLNHYGLYGNLKVLEEFRRFENSSSQNLWSTGPIIFLCFTMIILVSIFLATIYQWLFIDETTTNISCFDRRVQKLSARYNLERLFKEQESVNCICGIKVISMFLIIYGHRMLISMFSPIHNTYDNEKGLGDLLNMYYVSGLLIVDTFLVVTGFLSFNKMLKTIESGAKINPLKLISRRYMRFTPTYAVILAYTIWIHPYLDGGPLPHTVIWNTSGCSTSWWAHLLYINNYVYSKKQCMIPSWYLSADMQLYAFCSFCAYIMYRYKRKVGISVLVLASVLTVAVPATILLIKGYRGITLLYLKDFASYYENDEFVETYLQTHFRGTPYISGMLAALIYREMEKINIKEFKKRFKRVMMLTTSLSLISMHLTMLSAWWFYAPGSHFTLMDTTLYGVLHRLGWAIPIAWIIVVHFSNIYAPFGKLLSIPIFGILNQLGYCVFLTHTLFQLYIASLNRAPVFYNWLTSWWMASGDIVFSYGGAVLLYLAIEAPFSNLLNM